MKTKKEEKNASEKKEEAVKKPVVQTDKKTEPEKEFKKEKKRPEKKEAHKKRTHYEQIRIFSNFIKKAGFELSFDEINKKIIKYAGILAGLTSAYLLFDIITKKTFFIDGLTYFLSAVIIVAVVSFLVFWAGFFIYVDYLIYLRKKEIEDVFPDFLQLTAANINAGMPIDRALWFAIRPKFGILAKEMEGVAKATMVGENLNKALIDFSNKYDSITVKRSLNLLIEGLESGGEIGELLTKVAENMRETDILKKEMSSSVTTYVIFILFATLGAAPFLFGLTTELIVIMTSIMSNINIGQDAQSFGGIGAMLATSGGQSISIGDYQIFAITSICISSIFAAIIISVIQKGEIKEALKKIPFFVAGGVIIYFIAFKIMNWLLGGFFA